MYQWRVSGDETVDVSVHEHVIIEPVDAIVQNRPVYANMNPRRFREWPKERERVARLGRDRFGSEAVVEQGVLNRSLVMRPLIDDV